MRDRCGYRVQSAELRPEPVINLRPVRPFVPKSPRRWKKERLTMKRPSSLNGQDRTSRPKTAGISTPRHRNRCADRALITLWLIDLWARIANPCVFIVDFSAQSPPSYKDLSLVISNTWDRGVGFDLPQRHRPCRAFTHTQANGNLKFH